MYICPDCNIHYDSFKQGCLRCNGRLQEVSRQKTQRKSAVRNPVATPVYTEEDFEKQGCAKG